MCVALGCALAVGSCAGQLRGKAEREAGGDGASACSAGPEGVVVVRRLNRVEYHRTVRDLFPTLEIPEQTLVVDKPVHGFENASRSLNPSHVLVEQHKDAARAIAQLAAARAGELAPCAKAGELDAACARQLVSALAPRAFRRPLTREEAARLEAFFAEHRAEGGARRALEHTIEALLQSPQFLYRLEHGVPEPGAAMLRLSDYEVASRLSYFLWQSMPDDALFAAAARGELRTREQVAEQARRMVSDPRATRAVQDFHRQWLSLDRLMKENKDPKLYPAWNDTLRDAMREESDRFVAHAYESGANMLAELLTSRTTFVNKPLAQYYGVPFAGGEGWQRAELPAAERSGILTRANFLAAYAHTLSGSPPLRGVAVLDKLLCDPLPPPPPNADLSQPIGKGGEPRTNRELFAERTSPAPCRDCHEDIDAIGFGFERYDAMGSFRTVDNGAPVDATGALRNTRDIDGPFDGAIELSARLAGSEQVRACMVRNWFRYAFAREPRSADRCTLDALDAALARSGGDLRALLVAIATSYDFMHVPAD